MDFFRGFHVEEALKKPFEPLDCLKYRPGVPDFGILDRQTNLSTIIGHKSP